MAGDQSKLQQSLNTIYLHLLVLTETIGNLLCVIHLNRAFLHISMTSLMSFSVCNPKANFYFHSYEYGYLILVVTIDITVAEKCIVGNNNTEPSLLLVLYKGAPHYLPRDLWSSIG